MLYDAKDSLELVMNKIDSLFNKELSPIRISTGFYELDKIIGELKPSRLITIAGCTSVGKSILAMNIATDIAIRAQIPILIFSMENTTEEFMTKLLSSLSRIDLTNLRNGELEDDDWLRLSTAINIISESKLIICHSSGITPQDMLEQIDKANLMHGPIEFIIVDYIQLINVETGNQHPRATQIGEITRFLKTLACKQNVCVIAISQLNRDCEKRLDKRPILSDLLDLGSIENDSDLVLFIYRDEIHYEKTSDKGIAEIIVAKNRNGICGKIKLAYKPYFQLFEPYSLIC